MIVFGGRDENTFFNDLFEYNFMVWTSIVATGTRPSGADMLVQLFIVISWFYSV